MGWSWLVVFLLDDGEGGKVFWIPDCSARKDGSGRKQEEGWVKGLDGWIWMDRDRRWDGMGLSIQTDETKAHVRETNVGHD